MLDQIAEEYDGELKIAKLNIDQNPTTVMRYGVQGIPTLVVFKGGEQVERLVGAVSKEALRRASDSTCRPQQSPRT